MVIGVILNAQAVGLPSLAAMGNNNTPVVVNRYGSVATVAKTGTKLLHGYLLTYG